MAKTQSFIIERKIYLSKTDYDYLEKRMFIANRIYNANVKYYRQVLSSLHMDARFVSTFEEIHKLEGQVNADERIRELWNTIYSLIKEYKLTDYEVQDRVKATMNRSYPKSLHSQIAQKLGHELYSGIRKCLFSDKRILHYRKQGETNAIEGKSNITGIVYDNETDTLYFGNKLLRKAKLRPIRTHDDYLREAMTHKVKYCRIVRKPFGHAYRYYVQLVMTGTPPVKDRIIGKGGLGLDPGVSTIAVYNKDTADYRILADGIERYDRQLKRLSRQLERRLRLANSDCYDENGTPIKGKKPTVRTKGYKRAVMQLKTIYRKRSEYILLSHRTLANKLLSIADTIITEPMDYRALAKRVKETKRQEQVSEIVNSDGTVKQVQKFKRKKRFGHSILRRAPAKFRDILKDKLYANNGKFIEIDNTKYKASQYNHLTDEYVKPKLSDRTKCIGEHLVQRDLYSSYLLFHIKDKAAIDRNGCIKDFDNFLMHQNEVIEKVRITGDVTGNFGLKDFDKKNN